jgi:hypothetical protein
MITSTRSMQRTAQIVVVLALVAASARAETQVTARQGTSPVPQEVHFASPMILDLPFPNVTTIEPGSALRLPEVYRYICDKHVLLRGLTVTKQYKGPRKARSLELLISGQVFVAESYDRKVNIAFRLLSLDTEIAKQTLRNLKAEEERATLFRIVIPVDEQKLLSAYAAEEPPVLQLTVTVRDDS